MKKRSSSIELLRIISMIMIVACHFATHGGFNFDSKSLSITRLWWLFLELGGNVGVIIFVLISGYFLINNNEFSILKIIKFLAQVFIYSISIYLIFCIFSNMKFSFSSFIKALFPITFNSYWFASSYFVLYLIHPFLNVLLQNLEKKSYNKLLELQLILWCVLPTITTSDFFVNNILWFITIYCVAGYIRIYGLNPKFKIGNYMMSFFLFSALSYLSCIVLIIVGTKIPYAGSRFLYFTGKQSILTFLSALSLFMVFQKYEMKNNKYINTLASATFGIYLISDNYIIRHVIWHIVFNNSQYQNSVFLIPYSIFAITTVCVFCICIDLFRQKTIEKMFVRFIEDYSWKFLSLIHRAKGKFDNMIFGKED